MIIQLLSSVFWGLIVLSTLVFVHEGGHFLAARSCGVRVSEFFLGLPCRFRLAHVSKRMGTTFGVTPLLLGGYAAICGMEQDDNTVTPLVLAAIYRHGVASVSDLATELREDEDRILDACVTLCGWGSIAPEYPAESTSRDHAYYPDRYGTVSRDESGNTALDGKLFDRESSSGAGESWTGFKSAESFYERELSRTYCGQGPLKRCWILIAGILVNILCGFLLLMSVYSIIGVSTAVDTNVIGGVVSGSPAQSAGISAGDTIVSINGIKTDSWTAIVNALDAAKSDDKDTIDVTYVHGGKSHAAALSFGGDGTIGINVETNVIHLNPIDSARCSFSYIVQTAKGVTKLLIPTKTMEVLDQSTSIVGISIMSAEAAAAGPAVLLSFAGLISLSLGFMNLLPIPPLDGGKLLIEVIQALVKRPIPRKVQNLISYIGIALFGLLFVYMLRTDILRFF